MLKTQIHFTACLALVMLKSFAGPLEPGKVAGDAKWVVHLDLEAFRKTSLGQHLVEKLLKPKLEQNEQFKKLNLSINLENIGSLTAYGPAFEKNGEGVLVLSTTANVKKDLDTLVGMAALSDNEQKDFVMVQEKPFALYSFKNQVYFAPNVGNVVLLAKSRDLLEHARDVVLDKADNLAKAASFKEYPALGDKSYFVAMAEGFNDLTGIPPQAQVLRETKGARVALGEKDENVFLNLVFKANDEQTSTKIQQILQGLVALVSLSQPDKEITELANSSKIGSVGRNVSVDLRVPAAKAIKRIDEMHGGNPGRKARRNREKPPVEDEEVKVVEESKAAQEKN